MWLKKKCFLLGGAIETEPEPNYGNYTIEGKHYAKLRKEVHAQTKTNTSALYYVIAESSKNSTKNYRSQSGAGTTRQFTSTTLNPGAKNPYYYPSFRNESPVRIEYQRRRPTKVPNNPGIFYARTSNAFNKTNKITSTTTKPKNTQVYGTINSISIDASKVKQKPFDTSRSGGYDELDKDALLSFVDTLLDETKNETENKTQTIKPSESTTIDVITTETTTIEDITDTTNNLLETKLFETTTFETTDSSTIVETTSVDYTTATEIVTRIINETIEKSNNISDCFNRTAEIKNNSTNDSGNKTQVSTSVLEDVTIVDLESKVKVSIATLPTVPKIPPEIEAILNRTKQKDPDYEYDYNEPSLPPSLPNLRSVLFMLHII